MDTASKNEIPDLNRFKAIVIGASAGGIEALEKILPRLPKTYPLPIIIVLHIPSEQPSLLSKVFGSKTELRVKDAEDKEIIQPGTIYFAPPNSHLHVESDLTFSLSAKDPVRFSRPSIDVLFKSAAEAFGKHLVGVLLSGANEDGATGLKKIQDSEGLAIIQDPATAQVRTMPKAGHTLLSATPGFRKTEQVLSLDEIVLLLLRLNRDPSAPLGSPEREIGATKSGPDLKKSNIPDATERAKILLVDDLKDNLMALEALLRRDDIEIFKAKSGNEALELMIDHDFALTLIDVQMPEMSGFELAELMRGTIKTKNVPVIFITATARNQNFSFKGYESGAVDFLLKPLDTFAVKSKVNIFIELYQQKMKLTNQLVTISQNQKEQEELLTKLKKTQGELELANTAAKQAKDEAEQANEFKSAFLANMSHEIRTPLGAMLGFTDLLRDPGLSVTERNKFIDIISRNGKNLSVIINDVLDLSKVEAGQLNLEFTDTYPDQITNDVVSLLGENAKEKGLRLESSFDETTPKSIISDPTRVRQVLLNLVSNAIKFTQQGSVKVKSYGCKSESGSKAICFDISDTGIGIPEAQKENIFELFTQADETMTRRFGGTGLGLALSRKLARSLGGDVLIKKTSEDNGSTFLLQIADQPERRNVKTSLSPEDIKKNTEPQKNALEGMKVLVVDDSPDNQYLILHYLTKYGAIADSAENGEIGCQKALSGDYQIVLMDIQMPQMDGYTATRKLRAAGYQKPIIALTAHAMSEVRQKCLDAGYTAYLTKPINVKELVATVMENMH